MSLRRNSQGFTLLELLVVLAIMVMVYALVPPLFSVGGSTTELRAAARHLAAGLRKARSEAITGKTETLLAVDVEARKFRLSGDPKTYSLPRDAKISVYTARTEVVSEQTGAIRFYPDGSSTGGRITVASGERKFRINVDWLTGRVEIQGPP
jgi:general secretion pathway protein H